MPSLVRCDWFSFVNRCHNVTTLAADSQYEASSAVRIESPIASAGVCTTASSVFIRCRCNTSCSNWQSNAAGHLPEERGEREQTVSIKMRPECLVHCALRCGLKGLGSNSTDRCFFSTVTSRNYTASHFHLTEDEWQALCCIFRKAMTVAKGGAGA